MDVRCTLADAVTILEPPMTEKQLRAIIHALGWQPAGWEPNGRGHPRATYPWPAISGLHLALLPFLQESGYAFRGGVCPQPGQLTAVSHPGGH